ncbi:metal-dependent hydrolase [Pseudohongiella acticola]|uniref:Metal-dependent hydrolase n=1 Tax=Pseudohongiella acticola TaxID=1524254 RepID=A0A1E8CIS4_9GAMM|nr:SprT family zinc-dependent metalloprotease [Pseudohongiella acticola]OFE12346.1 metal-dependent hydrolase [Pseudohongiella acticola]
MTETISLGDIVIRITRKAVRNVHLSVHPPEGDVTLVAPVNTRLDVARAYAISKLGWIRERRQELQDQARETPRQFISRESHYVWGRRYVLEVKHKDAKPSVLLQPKKIILSVRPGTEAIKRAEIMYAWHRKLLHDLIPPLIQKWEAKLNVKVNAYYLQRMKTKWGSCTAQARNIRLNTELVKKPKDLVEYVLVHEMVHLIEPTHSERFVALLNQHCPGWREARAELNELPLGAEAWL